MYENPGDELYFGEVYRQILQEAWLPGGSEEWFRLGKSTRGWRPTQRGIGAQSPAVSQARVRLCFSLCADNWRYLPLVYPPDHPCYGVPGKQFWWDQKQERGLMCSYYDHYMRYCIYTCLPTGCISPDIQCYAWDPDSTKETIHGYWSPLYIIGGTSPFEWSVNDPPFWIRAVITTIRDNAITTREDVCGIANITVTDRCGRIVEAVVTTPDVPWPYLPPTWSPSNPEEITPDTSQNLYVDHGVPPFRWDVTGEHFSLDAAITGNRNNILNASPEACGSAAITIIDCLDNQVTGYVRSTAGQWVQKSEGVCGLSGEGTCIAACDTRSPVYELISGYHRQLQTSYCPANVGDGTQLCETYYWYYGKTLAEFLSDLRDSNCQADPPRCNNCIDSDHDLCSCNGFGTPRRTWCLGALTYYEWEC